MFFFLFFFFFFLGGGAIMVNLCIDRRFQAKTLSSVYKARQCFECYVDKLKDDTGFEYFINIIRIWHDVRILWLFD